MWSVPAAMVAMIVESEIGELWSPNRPPPSTAATASPGCRSMIAVIGITIGIIMAHVPNEVPVANAVMPDTTNNTAGTRAGCNPASVTRAT